MRRDPTEFRQRFAAWKDGENYWDTRGEDMLPGYSGGKTKNRARFLYTMDSEHFEANPYVDDVGVKTSGYGFTKNMDTIQNAQDRSYTKDEARRVLEKEMDYRLAKTYKYLNPEIRRIIQSNPQLEEMLGDALWQSPNGYGGRKSSLVAALNSRNLYGDNELAYWNNVANQFTRGNYYIRKDGTRIRLGGVMKRNNARAQAFRNMYKPKEKKAPTITEPIINNLQLVERPLILPDKPVLQTPLLAAELVKLPKAILRAPEHLNYPVLGNDYWENFLNSGPISQLQSLMQQLLNGYKRGKNILPRHADGKTPEDNIVYETLNTEDGTIYRVKPSAFGAEELNVTTPEVVVRPTFFDLTTYYPLVSDYFPGHSRLAGSKLLGYGNVDNFTISKRMSDAGYNLITNNCSDATREALEAATGNNIDPYLFTTPGDVLDFFKEQFPDFKVVKCGKNGKRGFTKLRAYVTPEQYDKAKIISDSLHMANVGYKHGKSPIHINPANKGKFNALKKRTGKTTELLTHSKNPLTRKRAIFALNSKKFKH